MHYFIVFRTWFSLILKISSIIFCIYLLSKASMYKIEWNLLSWLFPSVTSHINNMLSQIGISILMLPLTLCVLSLLYPANMFFIVTSAFFGLSGLVFCFVGQSLGSASTSYDMRLFKIYKVLNLEERYQAFKDIFKQKLEEAHKVLPSKTTIEDYTIECKTKIAEFSTNKDIATFADQCVQQLPELKPMPMNNALAIIQQQLLYIYNFPTEHPTITKAIFWALATLLCLKALLIICGIGSTMAQIGLDGQNLISSNIKTDILNDATVSGIQQGASNVTSILNDLSPKVERIDTYLEKVGVEVSLNTKTIEQVTVFIKILCSTLNLDYDYLLKQTTITTALDTAQAAKS